LKDGGRNGFNDRLEYSAFRSALRANALTGMLQPVASNNNCANDNDSVLVSILEKSSAALFFGGARNAARNASKRVISNSKKR